MYYNVDSPFGQKMMQEMQDKLIAFGAERGIKGVMNLREIQPEDFGLTSQVITVTGGESTYTLTRDVKENCALVIGGFFVNDQTLQEVNVYRGNAMLHNWSLYNIYDMQNRMGVRADPVYWGPGETMKLIFIPVDTSTADQTSHTWFVGFVLCPDMQSSVTRSAG